MADVLYIWLFAMLGVNAFVVKPVGFREFFDAIQDLGVFWAILNEPPPQRTDR